MFEDDLTVHMCKKNFAFNKTFPKSIKNPPLNFLLAYFKRRFSLKSSPRNDLIFTFTDSNRLLVVVVLHLTTARPLKFGQLWRQRRSCLSLCE